MPMNGPWPPRRQAAARHTQDQLDRVRQRWVYRGRQGGRPAAACTNWEYNTHSKGRKLGSRRGRRLGDRGRALVLQHLLVLGIHATDQERCAGSSSGDVELHFGELRVVSRSSAARRQNEMQKDAKVDGVKRRIVYRDRRQAWGGLGNGCRSQRSKKRRNHQACCG